VFHYVLLYSSEAGKKFGRFNGANKFTTKESERFLRLPMYYGLKGSDIKYIISKIKGFYNETE